MSRPVSFGYKMAWLAIRSDSPDRVIEQLDIAEATPTPWENGVDALYSSTSLTEHPIYVTPSLDGWVLAASPAYFEEASDTDPERLARFVTDLASRLGAEVQFFATHRVVEGHAWARADETGLRRAYYYLGEVGECLLDRGGKTPVEETLHCLEAGSSEGADEEAVVSVAGAWSVDPTRLEHRPPDVADGALGKVTVSSNEFPPESRQTPAPKQWWKFW